MKRGRVWLMVLAICIVTVTTVYCVSMMRNVRTSYANGRFVCNEIEYGNEAAYETGSNLYKN